MIEFVNPVIGIILISIVVSFILSLIYKLTTNQGELKKMNEELKELNAKFKEAQKNSDQKELMKLQSQMLQINSKKMNSTMKPMMITFLVIIPIFVFVFPSLYGDLTVKMDDSLQGVMKLGEVEREIQINENSLVLDGEEKSLDEVITVGESKFVFKNFDKDKSVASFKRIVVNLPISLPIWGSNIGWLGWYILVSIPFTTVFRKTLGIVQ